MEFIYVRIKDLMGLNPSNAYAGASNYTDEEDFRAYIKNKPYFGDCDADRFNYCYYAYTQNAWRAENQLLEQGFECNIQQSSNVQEEPGYVYVCTPRPRRID